MQIAAVNTNLMPLNNASLGYLFAKLQSKCVGLLHRGRAAYANEVDHALC